MSTISNFSLNSNRKSPHSNRGFRANQLSLFNQPQQLPKSSGPQVTLEPLPHRPDRVRLVIRQQDCVWGLVPHLSRSEGERLLDLLKAARVEFDLDLNEGWPVDCDIINAAVESLIESGLVVEVAA